MIVKMMSVVDVMKCNGDGSEDVEVYGAFSSKVLCDSDSVDENRFSSGYAIPKTVKHLVARWRLEVPGGLCINFRQAMYDGGYERGKI